jgi:hypothetical protein
LQTEKVGQNYFLEDVILKGITLLFTFQRWNAKQNSKTHNGVVVVTQFSTPQTPFRGAPERLKDSSPDQLSLGA